MRNVVASALVFLFSACAAAELRAASDSDQTKEPFGLDKSFAPDSSTAWQEWKRVIADADAELQKLERCRAQRGCNAAEEKYAAIVKEARGKDGRAKIEFVHRRVNGEIRYEPDPVQWGLPDHWSLPVDVESKGSLNTGVGDCEDYVLAKYLILLDARFPDKDLRILLVRDNFVRADHAILAARDDRKWLILDNRFDRLYEDADLKHFKPLMVVDTQGVYYLSKMFRIADAYDP
jgi:predicted transglutaminase-like cysteine proteinase